MEKKQYSFYLIDDVNNDIESYKNRHGISRSQVISEAVHFFSALESLDFRLLNDLLKIKESDLKEYEKVVQMIIKSSFKIDYENK